LASQLPKPALHVGTQPPAVHVVDPFALVQLVPQVPQLPVDVFRFASQPLVTFASQLPKPVLQAMAQAPSAQLRVPFVLLQALPQEPQLVTEVLVATSQPSEDTPLQLP
jgi:hypothetical protein